MLGNIGLATLAIVALVLLALWGMVHQTRKNGRSVKILGKVFAPIPRQRS